MIKSMTGFGKATADYGTKKVIVEVKSLNSKQLDINLRTPSLYKEKDIEIRNMIKNVLERGKVDMYIYFDNAEEEKGVAVNQAVVKQYYNQMNEVASSLGIEIDKGELLQTVMRFPDTMQVKMDELDEEAWNALRSAIEKALSDVDQFRVQEGKVLIADILKRVDLIKSLSAEVPRFEKQRVVTIKQRLQDKMKEWGEIKNIDENRLEQEIIYYLEKLDITEEKVRLANHCKYFIETVEKEVAPGRKLGFIAQEIGREINTMGSKANDHDIQKLVVRMKDELEKIKEQSLNVL
ncbi:MULTISPECIES: YicC/YloC family endoribonuclease [Butyricimonas]|jgi:TIGR00255 family protein|uniref:YicC family protein n=1 Tax=Butyricimonas hominis TaxID=2763032 RepID=A0ABR7CWC8_9BACT|nr:MULTISPECIES: YicC/YloC family endoribonuclease [Butyricimonas]MBC5619949.1 YicC family protein [Butyricimonas hominis]MCB6973828.1 YicC family protein [Butyricimonas synergistica]MCG4520639.1 YicC family protein [Butyricimonas sp. DFI.6.44]